MECFKIEKETFTSIQSLYAYDYVICGGGTEGHSIQKEVNFSDTLIHNNKLCRIAGSLLGADFTRVNAHGWFGYTLKIRPNSKNTIRIHLGSLSTQIDLFIRYGDQKQKVHFNKQEEEMTLTYNDTKNEDTVYIEFSRISSHTPCVYSIIVE